MTTISSILTDLEAKAKRVTSEGHERIVARLMVASWIDSHHRDYIAACSPDRILALVAWAKEVALPIIRTMAGNDPVFSYGQDGAESGMRCCFACGVEVSDNGTPFPHDEDCAHLVAQKTLADHLDAGEEKR